MTIESNINPFENYSGSARLAKPGFIFLLLIAAVVFALVAATPGAVRQNPECLLGRAAHLEQRFYDAAELRHQPARR